VRILPQPHLARSGITDIADGLREIKCHDAGTLGKLEHLVPHRSGDAIRPRVDWVVEIVRVESQEELRSLALRVVTKRQNFSLALFHPGPLTKRLRRRPHSPGIARDLPVRVLYQPIKMTFSAEPELELREAPDRVVLVVEDRKGVK
jgi:hypothetical protein